jgi:hypothetical protein
MMVEQLDGKTKKDLAFLAKLKQVDGWHRMTKAGLVSALRRILAVERQRQQAENDADRVSKATESLLVNAGNSVVRTAMIQQYRRQSKQQLIAAARQKGITNWRALRKEELVQTLVRLALAGEVATSNPAVANGHATVRALNRRTNGLATENPVGRLQESSAPTSPVELPKPERKDRIVALVRDPYWLHVYWELTQQSIQRTQAALGPEWYSAKPNLRLIDVTSEDTTNCSEVVTRDVPIHGGVNNWYLEAVNPPRSFRVDIGYLTQRGRFFTLARSNIVRTPRPGISHQIDGNWQSVQDECERIYAMSGGFDPNVGTAELRQLFEEQLRRPLSSGSLGEYGAGALANAGRAGFHFELDAELIVYGRTDPAAFVTVQNAPVQLRPDGTFTLRFSLPEGRQIIPGVARTANGLEERTVILAIERNTKELEPMVHDGQD